MTPTTRGTARAKADRPEQINLSAGVGKPRSSRAPALLGPPLQPRRTALVILLVSMAVWVGGLLTLYFKTIYPNRAAHDLRPAEASQSD